MSIIDALLIPLESEWKELDTQSMDAINKFIDRWELVFVRSGYFCIGLRVRPVHTHELHDCRHVTIDGALGILALNMAALKSKRNIA